MYVHECVFSWKSHWQPARWKSQGSLGRDFPRSKNARTRGPPGPVTFSSSCKAAPGTRHYSPGLAFPNPAPKVPLISPPSELHLFCAHVYPYNIALESSAAADPSRSRSRIESWRAPCQLMLALAPRKYLFTE